MKKSLIVLLALGALLNAGEYTDEDRIKDMQQMERDMAKIQKGFLYSNIKDVKQGAQSLRETVLRTEPPKEDISKTGMASYRYSFGKKDAAKIAAMADKIGTSLENGQPNKAMKEYNAILKGCISCHIKIRKW